MAKITRFNGNLVAPASAALGTERTLFGDVAQSDDLTDQFTADLLRGWGIVGPSDQPTLQDFNAMGFTLGQIHAYLHQMGVAEYNAAQEYHLGSIANVAGVLYVSLINTNIGNSPAISPSQWAPQSDHGMTVFSSAGITAWTVPLEMQLGIVKPKITVIGGGGGGSRRTATEGTSSGGGGGGGGISESVVDLTGVTSVTITVGAGGAGVAVNNTAGGNGGTTSFGAFLSATGGLGGGATSGAGASGVGIGGDVNSALGPGGAGIEYTLFGGASSVRITGAGGGPGGSSVLAGFGLGAQVGVSGIGPGGGGSGCAGAATSGSGANGLVKIEW